MRLIDADALLKDINDYPYGYRGMIKDTIAKQPTVDAVEVVQCKNCKYYDGEYHYCDNDVWAIPNGYCHHGERREDADT